MGSGNGSRELCIRYNDQPQVTVRGIATLRLGHLARIHGQLETDRMLPILRSALQDHDPFVRSTLSLIFRERQQSPVISEVMPRSFDS